MPCLTTIGILKTDSVMEAFQPDFGDYPFMLESLFQQVAEKPIAFRTYDVESGEYPEAMDDCDAYVITGSRKSVYDDDYWISRLEDYVRALHESRKKTVGICFGHQLVAQALGGQVAAADYGWGVGVKKCRLLAASEAITTDLQEFNLLVSHKDQVIELPPGSLLLAANEYCPHAMFQIDDHFLCVQGHPEFRKGYSLALMNFRRDILGEETYLEGVASLEQQTHEEQVAKWILDFIDADGD